jgi:hypothetical protein
MRKAITDKIQAEFYKLKEISERLHEEHVSVKEK